MTGPAVADERALELRARGLAAPLAVAWRRNSLGLSIVFFVLTAIAVLATFGFFELIDLPGAGFVTAAISLALAEWLIRTRHFFGTGIESALWLGGLFALIFGLPGEGRTEVILLFAAASAIAGWRVRNALFGGLAMALGIGYLIAKNEHVLAVVAAIVVTLVAVAALSREWQRPSTEAQWRVLAIIPTAVATLGSLLRFDSWWAIVFFVLAAGLIAAGLRLRAHTPLIGAAVNGVIGIAILAAHDLLPFAPEWQCMIGGVVLLTAGAVIARALRGRAVGIVTTPDSLTRSDDDLELLATLAAQPQAASPTAPADGGRFGGAGSTGEF
jgi:hypothetical protein